MNYNRSPHAAAKIAGVIALGVVAAVGLGYCGRACAACAPDATYTPTPTVKWTAPPDPNLAGHTVEYRALGGVYQKLADIPCQPVRVFKNGTRGPKICPGADLDIPLQRYCPSCSPLSAYEFRVVAWDALRNTSGATAEVSVCFSPVWTAGPYQ